MKVTGPITGGAHGWPFGGPVIDVGAHGYRVDEFFLEGEATRYRPVAGTQLGRDGRWQAEPAGSAPYKTRFVVYRPVDPEQFNGTVIASWNNVTAGYDLFGGDSLEVLEAGFAYVGVTVQRAGIEGLPPTPQGLTAWDPERYGSLVHPGDDHSFDIFTQAALAVGANRDRNGVDPMGGLDVRKVVAMGGSQSAGRLAAYVNAVQPLTHAFDGFLLTIYFGTGTQLEVGDAVVNINAPATAPAGGRNLLQGRNLLRDDLDAPVFVVNSELEAIACHGVRQPDTDRFRYWESAGTCHVSVQSLGIRAPKFERDFGAPFPIADGINRLSMVPLYDAAIRHLQTWITEGTPPPVQPRIEFAGEPAEIVRDEHGIATGGIRLPGADVPLAANSAIPLGPGIYNILQGSSRPFPAEKIAELYGDEAAFVARFEQAALAAEKAGVLLHRDVEALVSEARESLTAQQR